MEEIGRMATLQIFVCFTELTAYSGQDALFAGRAHCSSCLEIGTWLVDKQKKFEETTIVGLFVWYI